MWFTVGVEMVWELFGLFFGTLVALGIRDAVEQRALARMQRHVRALAPPGRQATGMSPYRGVSDNPISVELRCAECGRLLLTEPMCPVARSELRLRDMAWSMSRRGRDG